jgi:phosphoribosylformylglycinamidine synthase
MIQFFRTQNKSIIAVQVTNSLNQENIDKLNWLFSNSVYVSENTLEGWFIGPRKEMITPWSTNAVEITQNMGIDGVLRMEEFIQVENENAPYDHMLQRLYQNLTQNIFTINKQPDSILNIKDIAAYNAQEGTGA